MRTDKGRGRYRPAGGSFVEVLIVGVLGLLGIAAASMLSERIGVAAPLLLVLTGVGVSVLPGMPPVESCRP
jgi:CPA1 family monovalent cation:H+ antiporter